MELNAPSAYLHQDIPPYDLILAREEETPIFENEDALYNYQRETLRDTGPDPINVDSELKRDTRQYANLALNIREFGENYNTRPNHSDMFLDETGRDPRGCLNSIDWSKLTEQTRHRAIDHIGKYVDSSDNSVPEGGRLLSRQYMDVRKAAELVKPRLKIFETSNVSRNKPVIPNDYEQKQNNTIFEPTGTNFSDEMRLNRTFNPVGETSNQRAIGYYTKSSHRFPVSTINIMRSTPYVNLNNPVSKEGIQITSQRVLNSKCAMSTRQIMQITKKHMMRQRENEMKAFGELKLKNSKISSNMHKTLDWSTIQIKAKESKTANTIRIPRSLRELNNSKLIAKINEGGIQNNVVFSSSIKEQLEQISKKVANNDFTGGYNDLCVLSQRLNKQRETKMSKLVAKLSDLLGANYQTEQSQRIKEQKIKKNLSRLIREIDNRRLTQNTYSTALPSKLSKELKNMRDQLRNVNDSQNNVDLIDMDIDDIMKTSSIQQVGATVGRANGNTRFNIGLTQDSNDVNDQSSSRFKNAN
jgi:hypothetical protein